MGQRWLSEKNMQSAHPSTLTNGTAHRETVFSAINRLANCDIKETLAIVW